MKKGNVINDEIALYTVAFAVVADVSACRVLGQPL
jgi:hypothetical protein